jgi:hypothetical protein
VNQIALLLVLLAASYLASLAASAGRGRALASGTGALLLGVLLGPRGLGVIDGPLLRTFYSIAAVAIGWVALAVGLEFGFVGDRRVRAGVMVFGNLAGLACGGAVAAATGLVLWWLDPAAGWLVRPVDRVLALGLGAALADTARDAFRWGLAVVGAHGPLADLLAELGDADDLAPVLLAASAFAVAPGTDGMALAGGLRLLAEPALGLALGLLAALLFGRDFRRNTVLGVVFGTSLTGLGLAAWLGLSLVGTCFALGLTLSLASRHAVELRELALRVERPILLPALLLAGGLVDPVSHPRLALVVAAALAVRLTVKLAGGGLVLAIWPEARRGGGGVAATLTAAGPLGVVIGLAFALSFPGEVGATVLAAAVAAAVLGELTSTPALRRALRRAGELEPADGEPDAVAVRP